jgi:hypothetical protein
VDGRIEQAQGRLMQEWKIASCKSEKRCAAGNIGNEAKYLKRLESGLANASDLRTQNLDFASDINIKIKKEDSKDLIQDSTGAIEADRTGGPAGFEEFWKAYPKRLGTNPRKPAIRRYKESPEFCQQDNRIKDLHVQSGPAAED